MRDYQEAMADFLMEMGVYDDEFAKVNDPGYPVDEPRPLWRIELPDGAGLFSSHPYDPNARIRVYEKLASFGADRLARENNEHMGITGKAFYRANGGAHYACDSAQSLDDWFNLSCRKWAKDNLDARIVQYEVQPGQAILPIGHGEVIFNKRTARKVATLDAVSMQPIAA